MAEIPDWVSDTWPDHTYQLVIMESGDSAEECIDMTRAEYIAVKAHLAALRGYTVGDVAAGVTKMAENASAELSSVGDEQQAAAHIISAREVYRLWPEIVVAPDSDGSIGAVLEGMSAAV